MLTTIVFKSSVFSLWKVSSSMLAKWGGVLMFCSLLGKIHSMDFLPYEFGDVHGCSGEAGKQLLFSVSSQFDKVSRGWTIVYVNACIPHRWDVHPDVAHFKCMALCSSIQVNWYKFTSMLLFSPPKLHWWLLFMTWLPILLTGRENSDWGAT